MGIAVVAVQVWIQKVMIRRESKKERALHFINARYIKHDTFCLKGLSVVIQKRLSGYSLIFEPH